MKKIFILLFLAINVAFGQSNLILPQGATSDNAGHILKTNSNVQGYNHTNGTIGFGTYVGSKAYIQTHTPHSLNFAVNNGTPAVTLSYSTTQSLSRNLGIGIETPQERLHVVGNIRSSNLAGTGTRNVYADENGTLTTAAQTNTMIVTPQQFVRRYNSGNGTLSSSGAYIQAGMVGAGATDQLVASFTLPVGATLVSAMIYYHDNDPDNNLRFIVGKSAVSNAGIINDTILFQNTVNSFPYTISSVTSAALNWGSDDNTYFTISVSAVGLTQNSSGIWNYAGGNTNLMAIKGVKITYTL